MIVNQGVHMGVLSDLNTIPKDPLILTYSEPIQNFLIAKKKKNTSTGKMSIAVPWDGDLYYSFDGLSYKRIDKESYEAQETLQDIVLPVNTNVKKIYIVGLNNTTMCYSDNGLTPNIITNIDRLFVWLNNNTDIPENISGNFGSLFNYKQIDNLEAIDLSTYPNACYMLFAESKNINGLTFPSNIKTNTSVVSNTFSHLFENSTFETVPDDLLPYTEIPRTLFFNTFLNCKNLIKAPKINATKFGINACIQMFKGCESLVDIPDITVEEVIQINEGAAGGGCFNQMFDSCTSLKKLPNITLNSDKAYAGIFNFTFRNCSSLEDISKLSILSTQFTLSAASGTFQNCTSLKISDVETEEYNIPFRIPKEGEGVMTGATTVILFNNMFQNISPDSPWSGTPELNKTYYLPAITED